MSVDLQPARETSTNRADPGSAPATPGGRTVPTSASADSLLAVEIRTLVERNEMDEARERFSELVSLHQRRASRIAYQYLRDTFDADEAVQDASLRYLPILRRTARRGRSRSGSHGFSSMVVSTGARRAPVAMAGSSRATRARRATSRLKRLGRPRDSTDSNPEQRLLGRERRQRLASAIDRLDGRQRTVFMLCHYGDCTPREVSAMTGLNESTVRVHLFRAARKLRVLLGGKA